VVALKDGDGSGQGRSQPLLVDIRRRTAGAPPAPHGSYRAFFYRTLIVVGTLIGVLALWRLSGVLLLVFAAVLIAVILDALAKAIGSRSPLGTTSSLVVAVVLVALLMAAAVFFFGAEIAVQVDVLSTLLPAAWDAVRARIEASEVARPVLEQLSSFVPQGQIISTFGSVVSGVTGIFSSAVLVLVGGVYIAAQPMFYVQGMLKLVPPGARPLSADFADTAGRALRLWLVGQLVAMVIVGLMTGIGLWLIGVPSPLALGLMAGLLEFIPFAGPILAAIPALLLAAIQGTDTLLWTCLLYLVVQQIEGSLVQPLVQKRSVDLPPALTIFSLIALSSVFGPLGLILAAPLTVVLYVGVKKLYLQEVLDEQTTIPGERID
jgi:predicted PurR-regulated permease PerM